MGKIRQIISSMALMGTLFIVLAVTLAIATFIENDFGTNAANALVYQAWWFELIFVVLGFNMFFNLIKFNLWRIEKLPVLLFHLSFFIIIIGAAVTRYSSFEGTMHIREGESSDKILTSDSYLTIKLTRGTNVITSEKRVLFSELTKNNYSEKLSIGGEIYTIKSVDFVPNATFKPSAIEGGEPLFTLVIGRSSGREEIQVGKGSIVDIDGILLGFNTSEKCDIQLNYRNNSPFIISSSPMSFMAMQTQTNTQVPADSIAPFYQNVLYTCKQAKFVLTGFLPSAKLLPVKMPKSMEAQFPDAVILQLSDSKGKSELLTLTGAKGALGTTTLGHLDDVKIEASLGSKYISIPYTLHLNDFQLERYPGSHSPSSFASEVTLKDGAASVNKRIYMNNILNYGGYRFYQSSYDTDELGTVLSVNHDYWGTGITYLGYLLLALSMIGALVMPNTRFRYLITRTQQIANEKKSLIMLLILMLSFTVAYADDIKPPHPISVEMASQFGSLWVQDNGGRIEPLNTLTNEVCRKIVKHNSFMGYNSNQIFLSFLIDPDFWQQEKLITISSPDLKQILGITSEKASFQDFLTSDGGYKLQSIVENAYRNKASARNKTEQDAIKVDEQMNVFYMAQTGGFLKLFPNPSDINAPWLTPGSTPVKWNRTDSLIVNSITTLYLDAVLKGDIVKANEFLTGIKKFQRANASKILPSDLHLHIETIYNNINLFLWLAVIYFIVGIILLIFQFAELLTLKYKFKLIIKIGFYILLSFFALQTIGMGVRWYLSGHAPWSNGYESMLYISWTTILAGLLFYRKSSISLSATALFGGILLMVAHLSWMNPEITNLVPVLKSYWLTIHVAIIVASYGFLSLGALLGFLNLVLMGLKSENNFKRLKLTIEELSCIAEMTVTVGLYMLTVGAFLGGVWANESWGRYWGWDPKETWSIITVFVYSFIIHTRLIPSLKDLKIFNFAIVLGFSSVIMTYLGVNYYLAGMHSYAKGDAVPVPVFVYYTLATIFVVSFYAFYNEGKLMEKHKKLNS